MMKKAVYWLVFVTIVGSGLRNIYRQATTLWQAKKDNQNLRNEILKTEKEVVDMTRRLEYATSSAYVEEQARELFGLGTDDDYWLILSPEEEIDLYPNMDIKRKKAKMKEWWNWMVGVDGIEPSTTDL